MTPKLLQDVLELFIERRKPPSLLACPRHCHQPIKAADVKFETLRCGPLCFWWRHLHLSSVDTSDLERPLVVLQQNCMEKLCLVRTMKESFLHHGTFGMEGRHQQSSAAVDTNSATAN